MQGPLFHYWQQPQADSKPQTHASQSRPLCAWSCKSAHGQQTWLPWHGAGSSRVAAESAQCPAQSEQMGALRAAAGCQRPRPGPWGTKRVWPPRWHCQPPGHPGQKSVALPLPCLARIIPSTLPQARPQLPPRTAWPPSTSASPWLTHRGQPHPAGSFHPLHHLPTMRGAS